MKMPPPTTENQNTSLLTTEENLQVFKLLGNRCQTMATTVVQLFVTAPPNHQQWHKKGTGVLCLVRDSSRKNYFFRLFSLKRNNMVWEHEMYNNMEYIESMPDFHMFEGEEYIVAFNFASQSEARNFKTVVDQRIMANKRREEKKARQISQSQSLKIPRAQLDFGNNRQEFRKEKRKRNITKADIGDPSNFVHVSHVGWNPNTGFDVSVEDVELKALFERAGVSDKQLQDKETRDFIYDFISKHQDSNDNNNVGPPVVPPRGPTRPPAGRPAPPPPPSHGRAPSQDNSAPRKPKPPSPPKQLSAGGQSAPPPPPPPPAMIENVPPPPLMKMRGGGPPPPMPDGNSALLQSIREGTTLKHVEERKSSPIDDARGDLLSEIRKGIQLKPVDEREIRPSQNLSPTNTRGTDLASALKQALLERSKVIHSEDDDDDTSSSSDDDAWD